MILDRLYTPKGGELIYHYCSPVAFLEIMKTRTVWLSAYYSLNDSTERNWGYSIFAKAIKQVEAKVGAAFVKQITAAVDVGFSDALLMISSYSPDPDVLYHFHIRLTWRCRGTR
jgi:hypothetical protein